MSLKFILFNVLLLISIRGSSQSKGTWGEWRQLYSDGVISIQVQFYTPKKNSCQDSGKEFKFRYRVKGRYYVSPRYVNWKLDYLDCDGQPYYQMHSLQVGGILNEDISSWRSIESLEYSFPGSNILVEYYDVLLDSSPKYGSGRKEVVESLPPTKIVGKDRVFAGSTITLSIDGGKLGTRAEWRWYEDKCGGRLIGKGESIDYKPTKTTRVYVQAFGVGQKSRCVNKLIEVISDNYPPEKIEGPENICIGSHAELIVKGGNIKSDAEWVWYKDDCGKTKIGFGEKISVAPKVTSTYYVRAEDNNHITDCTSFTVTVSETPAFPKAIISTDYDICTGETIELRVEGDKPMKNANWNWYSNDCNGSLIGVGEKIKLTPDNTTVYFVRSEGGCEPSICANVKINVKRKVDDSFAILTHKIGDTGNKFYLKVDPSNSGGNQITWQWYKNDCNQTSNIGSGDSISVNPKNQTTYYVKGVNECGESTCKNVIIFPIGSYNQPKHMYSPSPHFHYSFGLGLVDWLSFDQELKGISLNIINTKKVSIDGLGIPFSVDLYPIISDNFTLGFNIGMVQGVSAHYLNSGSPSSLARPNATYDLNYSRFFFGGEIALGNGDIRLIGKISRIYQKVDFMKTEYTVNGSSTDFLYYQETEEESHGLGIRFGSYVRSTGSGGNCVDIMFNVLKPAGLNYFDLSFGDMVNTRQGMEIIWWSVSKFKIKLSVVGQRPGIIFYQGNLVEPSYNFGFLFNWGRFHSYSKNKFK